MLFLCTSLIIGGFRYRKKGGIVDLPLSVTLTPPMDDKYYCNRLITFHCHSSRKFRIYLASIAVASSDLFCIFAPPYSNDLYPPMIFEFSKVTNICE